MHIRCSRKVPAYLRMHRMGRISGIIVTLSRFKWIRGITFLTCISLMDMKSKGLTGGMLFVGAMVLGRLYTSAATNVPLCTG